MLAIGIILIVAAIFLTIAVLMQHGKSHNLSGTIAGASETFFGKSKASTIDKKLSVLTTVVAIIFVILVLVAYLVQDIGTGTEGTVATSSQQQITSGKETTAASDKTTTTADSDKDPADSADAEKTPADSADAEKTPADSADADSTPADSADAE